MGLLVQLQRAPLHARRRVRAPEARPAVRVRHAREPGGPDHRCAPLASWAPRNFQMRMHRLLALHISRRQQGSLSPTPALSGVAVPNLAKSRVPCGG